MVVDWDVIHPHVRGGGVRSWDRHVEEDRGARSNRDRNKLSHSLSIREIVLFCRRAKQSH